MTERERAWLACYHQRVEARRERQRRADACCVDCGNAGRDDHIEQARYHTRLAKDAEREASPSKAETLEKTATRLFTSALVVFALSLAVLAFSLIALLDG